MKKTIEQILLDSLKDKHVTVYAYINPNPSFSGFVRDLKIKVEWESTYVILSVDTGKEKLEKFEIDFTDYYLEVC